MKYLKTWILQSALLVLSLTTFAQKKDSVKVIYDSTPLISVKDYRDFYNSVVAKLPTEQGILIIQYWEAVINKKVQALKSKK